MSELREIPDLVADEWNKTADRHNKWGSLSVDEQVEFAYRLGKKHKENDDEPK